MLVGYVSDERHLALPDVAVELESATASAATYSRATGAVHADLPPGRYRVTLSHPGYGPKWVEVEVGSTPHQFRLLRDGLLGYVWPKWVRPGESAGWRVHAP